jgi:DNA-binding XRE family transcriptional regulator
MAPFAHGGRRAGELVSTVEIEQAVGEYAGRHPGGNAMMLLREAIGDRLRRTRTSQHRTLREVSRVARVSLGYLSEVERGRKEPSSELLASICDALDLPLDELLRRVANDLGPVYLPEVPDTLAAELVAA